MTDSAKLKRKRRLAVTRRRDKLHAEGLRPAQFRIPDLRKDEAIDACRRNLEALRNAPHQQEHNAICGMSYGMGILINAAG
ncbi:MAG: antitoxin MazE-like protein [Pyramidobacter sp.]